MAGVKGWIIIGNCSGEYYGSHELIRTDRLHLSDLHKQPMVFLFYK